MFGAGIVHEYDTKAIDPIAETIHVNVRHIVTVSGVTLREAWETFEFTFDQADINPSSSLLNTVWPKAKQYVESLLNH